ncbi:MAG TPA: hypothetical protein VHX88_15475 [Solirubrobacteraceae bacterium]|jgi:protein ImuB|nr:hypothetical protein [Solirubrobacteraceae bacterium]
MIVCVRLPRLELLVAAGGPSALAGRAVALAPLPGGAPRVGEVSGAAESFGVQLGMMLGEALARCPSLELVTPDPVGVTEAWERTAATLEGIGAAVELSDGAYFDARPLYGLNGGQTGVLLAAQRAMRTTAVARIGMAPTRFCALAAALQARAQRPQTVAGSARDYLSGREVTLLALRPRTERLVRSLTRLGILTLGELAALPAEALADRFGPDGVLAWRLARGEDAPPVPRSPLRRVRASLALEEAATGQVLERALGVLIDRLLAHPERRGRPVRSAVLAARLVEGGTWREKVVFRSALSHPDRMRLALAGRLALLPAPAEELTLAAEELAPAGGETPRPLLGDSAAVRRARLLEGVAQARATAGTNAALRVVCVDEDSRVPERRVMLTPWEGPAC